MSGRGRSSARPPGTSRGLAGPSGVGSPGVAPPRGGTGSGRSAPKFLHYLYLNLAVWLFLGVQAVVLARSLGSSQTVLLFTAILGLGFLAVSVFDYLWLQRRDGHPPGD